MPRYTVKFAFTGITSITVEAEDEDAAIEKAYEETDEDNIDDWEADKASAEVIEEE